MIYYLFTMLLNVVASFFGNKRVADLFRCSSVLIETSGHLKGVKKSWAVYFSKMCVMSGCLLRDIKLAGLHCWLWKQERLCEPCVLIGYRAGKMSQSCLCEITCRFLKEKILF